MTLELEKKTSDFYSRWFLFILLLTLFLLLLHNKLSNQAVDNRKDRREENHADQAKEVTPNQGCG